MVMLEMHNLLVKYWALNYTTIDFYITWMSKYKVCNIEIIML